MGRLLDIAKAALTETEAQPAGQPECGTGAPTQTVATAAVEIGKVAVAARVRHYEHDLSAGVESPAWPCYACHARLFWVSVYGAVICARCHPPANRGLVREWYWLPERQGRTPQ
jgi:hypothetical protein